MDALDPSVTDALRTWPFQLGAGMGLQETLAECAPWCATPQEQACFQEALRRAHQGEPIERLLEALAPLLRSRCGKHLYSNPSTCAME